jgi:hypothetical protein
MQPVQVSSAFQAALGVLVNNSSIARRCIADSQALGKLVAGLTPADRVALQAFCRLNERNLLSIASMVSRRRREKVMLLLPVTLRILGSGFEKAWRQYLADVAPPGLISGPEDAATFAAWIMPSLHSSGWERQFVRIERCRAEVLRKTTTAHELPAACVADLGLTSRVRTAETVVIERFEEGVESALQSFLSSRELQSLSGGPGVFMLFHPDQKSAGAVGIKKLTQIVAAALERARQGVGIAELLSNVPTASRRDMSEMLNRLTALDILRVVT